MLVQRFCNFANVLSLQKFDNEDLSKMEQMVKDKLKDWLRENTEAANFVDYFGPVYHANPEQFTFTCGDQKMILQISDYVKLKIRTKGYGYFQRKKSQCSENTNQHATYRDATEEELQDELFHGTLNLLQPYGDKVTTLFEKEMVSVTIEDGEIKGHIRCILCESEIETTKKRRKISYAQYWNGQKWILSNYANHHLRNAHPITINKNQTSNESNIDETNSQPTSIDLISPEDDLKKGSNVETILNDERM